MHLITVYTKPACVQCNATVKALDKAGISYEKIDVNENPEQGLGKVVFHQVSSSLTGR